MVDIFAIGLTHALLALFAWRLMQRGDLDADPVLPDEAPAPPPEPRGRLRRG
jgi:hypothetical protein